nr:L-threonylcarbamoyladenylate synthase [bacterium]
VVDCLKNGGIIAFPTDSTYGIGCDLYDKVSVDKLYQIKDRDRRSPFSFLCADLSDLAKYAKVSNKGYKLMRHLTPGPYTFILDATRLVPKIMRTKRYTVGIRVPDNTICNEVITGLGNPIISTTAKDGDEFLADPWRLREIYGEYLDLVVDGGPLLPGLTTIVDLTGPDYEILRHGKGDLV